MLALNNDLLFMRWNGLMVRALKYVGNNTFDDGFQKAQFELLENGGAKVTMTVADRVQVGEKFVKYPD